MHLTILSSEFPPGPGGIGAHAYHLGAGLHRLGWGVSVITSQDYASVEEISQFNRSLPFRVVRFRAVPTTPLKALYRWSTTRKIVGKSDTSILVATGAKSVWIAARVACAFGLPWVAIGHATEFGVAQGFQRKLTINAYESASAIICVSRYTEKTMLAMGIHPQVSTVIPNGADHRRFRILQRSQVEEFRRSLGFGDAHLLLTVGNVSDRKGQEIVIRALPGVLAVRPNTYYLMAGLPSKKEELSRLASELGVAAHVHFLGRVESSRLVSLMNACDLFVMTSQHTSDGDFEGFGIAVVEAAFCGKAAVVSGGSGLEEAVLAGETGLVVPQSDPGATAAAILRLLGNPERHSAMAAAARCRALREQTWQARVDEYSQILKSVLSVGMCGSIPQQVSSN
jgi:phosphatidylinositol alpha-1,6-mannosyltransferase